MHTLKYSYLNLVKPRGDAKDQGKKTLELEEMVRVTINMSLDIAGARSEFACVCHVLIKDLDARSAS